MDSLDLIRQFAGTHGNVPPERIVPGAQLSDVGVDSLMLLELMFDFEERTGITLPKNLPNPKTVQDLVDQLDALRTQGPLGA